MAAPHPDFAPLVNRCVWLLRFLWLVWGVLVGWFFEFGDFFQEGGETLVLFYSIQGVQIGAANLVLF